jgi:diguanylate cyclase (GGDEF)-like protein
MTQDVDPTDSVETALNMRLADQAATPEVLYNGCRQIARRFFHERVEGVFEFAHGNLFGLARDAPSDSAQQDFFDAMQELHRLRETVIKGFKESIDEGFYNAWRAEFADPQVAVENAAGEDMALVDTQSLADEVHIVSIIQHAGASLKSSEFELAARLSVLLPVPLSQETNPLSVMTVCNAFHDALRNLGAQRQTRHALFQGLSRSIALVLGDMQNEVNGYLVEHDVHSDRPLLTVKKESMPTSPAPRAPSRGAADANHPKRGMKQSATRDNQRSTPTSTSPLTHDLAFGQVSRSVRKLMALGRAVDAELESLADSAPVVEKPGARELLDKTLGHIQRSREAVEWGERGPFELAKRVDKALAVHGLTVTDAATKDGVELVSNLYDSILADPLVPTHAKPWIRHVAIPVLRVALNDGAFFASETHPARAVINSLGELAFGQPRQSSPEMTLFERTNRSVRELCENSRPDDQAFAASTEVLNQVVSEQAELRARNVSKGREALLAKGGLPETDKEGTLTSGTPSLRARDVVENMALGTVVVVQVGGVTAARAELGWHSQGREYFTFVNALGYEVVTFEAMQLAHGLDTGVVEVAEMARMPVVDRAMCGVLDRIHEKLEHKATSDLATGLATAKPLARAIARALGQATSSGKHHHLIQVGIDTFAQIRSRLNRGEAATVAKKYAGLLERQVGEQGRVARIGDAQFVLFLPDSRRADVEGLVERHKKSVEMAKLAYKGTNLPLQVSIGAVGLGASVDNTEIALAALRDVYLQARQEEGNSIIFAETLVEATRDVPREDGQGDGQATFQSYLEQNRLGLRAQRIEPIVASDGSSPGLPYYEVLLGIREVDGTLRPPGDLVLAAERSGQVGVLDRWVLKTAFAWMRTHSDWLQTVQGLSLNVSGTTLADPGLSDEVHALIDYYSVDPTKVVFEVTESAAIGPMAVAEAFIRSLRDRGCRFALDDFGAGHSSFSYLKILPVDIVKIDGLFVREIASSSTDRAMVRSLNEIAKLFGKNTVAEFVEDEEALEVLRGLGVDYAQGFGIERPMPIELLPDPRDH